MLQISILAMMTIISVLIKVTFIKNEGMNNMKKKPQIALIEEQWPPHTTAKCLEIAIQGYCLMAYFV